MYEDPTLKVLLTPEEAAARLGIGRTKVFDLIANGRLRSVSIGRSRRVPTAALEAFVAQLLQNDRDGE